MYQIDFNQPQKVHFIGIGGISMSGLAEILMDEGFTVTGSDAKESELTRHLVSRGAAIYYGQKAENIEADVELVVFTAAIHPDNPEYMEAVQRDIPMMTRAELLGQMMKNYKHAIAVAGTHGKTTTTSMITEIFMAAKKDPTITVGGILPSIGGNIRVGGPDYFVLEACEYTNSFHSFFPTTAVILNIEEDHMDFFKDIHDIRASFTTFMELVPEHGLVIINGDMEDVPSLTKYVKGNVVTFGLTDANEYTASDISYDEYARPSFDLLVRGENKGRIALGVQGEHNVCNALSAIACGLEHGLDLEAIKEGLMNYRGTDRRFEKKGEMNGVVIIDDYAHHPQEIEATLKAAKNYPHKKLWCAFQPHTYTRTAAFLEGFAEALSLADAVILADIYAAREVNTLGVSSEDIVKLLQAAGKEAYYLPTFPEIEAFAREHTEPGDLFITMGAGDIVEVGEHLL